jgi:hypothetical protein
MQTALQQEGVRSRLARLVSSSYGDLTCLSVRQVSKKAHVHYTSLARYLLYPKDRRTASLRRETLDAVAIALDANPQWVRDGQGPRQLTLWPILLRASAETGVSDPVEQMTSVATQVKRLPPRVQVLACRAAVAAMLDVVSAEGETLDDQAYRCLMRLDALRRTPGRRAG